MKNAFLNFPLALKQPRAELEKYLDIGGFEKGDLFYIQNLIYTLEAPGVVPTYPPTGTPTPTSNVRPGDANNDGRVNISDYVIWVTNYDKNLSGYTNADFNNNGKVDGVDFVIWLKNYTS